MYFHTDLNGCPEELTDENGEILWECSFQLWGKRIHEIERESVEQNLRYQGQYLDRETGLHYNTFRYYDPDIGRFTQPDPIGLLGGFNLYQYAPNAFGWIDPLGLQSCPVIKAKNRKDALRRAKDHAKVSRISRGGEKISIDQLNVSSRGQNWSQMKSAGAKSLGQKQTKGKNYWFEHPDGHADAGSPGVPKHHDSGHIHSVNSKGEEIVIIW